MDRNRVGLAKSGRPLRIGSFKVFAFRPALLTVPMATASKLNRFCLDRSHMQKEIAVESNVCPEMHVIAMMAEVQGLPNLAGPAAGQPLNQSRPNHPFCSPRKLRPA